MGRAMARKRLDNPVIVKWRIDTGYPTAKHGGEWEIDRAEWENMNEKDREEMLSEWMEAEIANRIEGSWEVEE